MRTQVISSFVDTSAWRLRLLDAVYGSAVAGNGDARQAVLHPDKDLDSRVRIDHPYLRNMALKLAEVNKLWQRAVGRISALNVLPAKRITSMLSCPLPNVMLYGQKINSFTCKCQICPNCLYNRLVNIYQMLAKVVQPGMLVYEHMLTAHSQTDRILKLKLAEYSNERMTKLWNKRWLPWAYGVSLTQPRVVPANLYHDTYWQCVTRTLAVAHPDTWVKTGELAKFAEEGNIYTETCKLLGEVSPKLLLDGLMGFSYPSVLLYNSMSGIDLFNVYATLHSSTEHKNTPGKQTERTVCRSRAYGMKRQVCEFEEKDVKYAKDNEQCASWRSAFKAPDLGEPAGDQERLLRLIGPDNRVLCDEPVVAGTHG